MNRRDFLKGSIGLGAVVAGAKAAIGCQRRKAIAYPVQIDGWLVIQIPDYMRGGTTATARIDAYDSGRKLVKVGKPFTFETVGGYGSCPIPEWAKS